MYNVHVPWTEYIYTIVPVYTGPLRTTLYTTAMYNMNCSAGLPPYTYTPIQGIKYNFPGPRFTLVHVYRAGIKGARLYREGPGSARVKNRHHVTTTCVPRVYGAEHELWELEVGNMCTSLRYNSSSLLD